MRYMEDGVGGHDDDRFSVLFEWAKSPLAAAGNFHDHSMKRITVIAR